MNENIRVPPTPLGASVRKDFLSLGKLFDIVIRCARKHQKVSMTRKWLNHRVSLIMYHIEQDTTLYRRIPSYGRV